MEIPPSFRLLRRGAGLLALLLASGCAGTDVARSEASADGVLHPCPARPNCVNSDATDSTHRIAPLPLGRDPEATWSALIAYLESTPGFTIKVRRQDYLHVESRTRLLRFVDDVEFQLRPAGQQIAVRSASRVGWSDLGTNRRRIETIRAALDAAEAPP